ncbi:NUDIX hydrolase [Candidatus Microgenomates bacterium]|nr:NUDIX hydrolase [Candidatus Microgenomates bacterium]
MNHKDKQIIVVVSAVLRKEGSILLLKRSNKNKTRKQMWQFPEGKIEFGETPEKALIREVSEETGLKIKNLKLLTITTNKVKAGETTYHVLRIVFEANCEGKITLSDEHSDYIWCSPKNLKSLKTVEGVKEIISKV